MNKELARLIVVALFGGIELLRALDRKLARSSDPDPWISPWS